MSARRAAGRQLQDDPPQHPLPDSPWLRRLRQRLRTWYRGHRRDLPWRRTGDLYAIWVSEIMLQQTQVATVVQYFERFMQAFPGVAALAAADESEVLRQWEGLGYYRRARQLHQAAQIVAERHQGDIPEDVESLRRLPGIGRYTAGAILSIGLDQPLPILEANTLRLFSRLLGYQGDPRSSAGQRLLWTFAEQLAPARGAGELNQALMEVGSEVCRPQAPDCAACPLRRQCRAFELELQSAIPLAPPRKQYEDLTEAAVVVRRGTNVLLRQCAADERWAGMWDFVRFPCEVADHPDGQGRLRRRVHDMTGVTIGGLQPLTVIKHGVTRFRITLHCYTARCRRAAALRPAQQWTSLESLGDLPLSVTGRRISRLL